MKTEKAIKRRMKQLEELYENLADGPNLEDRLERFVWREYEQLQQQLQQLKG